MNRQTRHGNGAYNDGIVCHRMVRKVYWIAECGIRFEVIKMPRHFRFIARRATTAI